MGVQEVQNYMRNHVLDQIDKSQNRGLYLVMRMITRVRHILLGVNITLKDRIKWCGYTIRFLFVGTTRSHLSMGLPKVVLRTGS